jgi:hypothetical protein
MMSTIDEYSGDRWVVYEHDDEHSDEHIDKYSDGQPTHNKPEFAQ